MELESEIIFAKRGLFRAFGNEKDGFRYEKMDEIHQDQSIGSPSENKFASLQLAAEAAAEAGRGWQEATVGFPVSAKCKRCDGVFSPAGNWESAQIYFEPPHSYRGIDECLACYLGVGRLDQDEWEPHPDED